MSDTYGPFDTYSEFEDYQYGRRCKDCDPWNEGYSCHCNFGPVIRPRGWYCYGWYMPEGETINTHPTNGFQSFGPFETEEEAKAKIIERGLGTTSGWNEQLPAVRFSEGVEK